MGIINGEVADPNSASPPPSSALDFASEVQNDVEEISKQIQLDMSSLNRNIVTLPCRSSAKLLKKSSIIKEFDDILYKEPVSARQIVGLATWNKILSRDSIPK